MELKDFLITPIWLCIIYTIAMIYKKRVTDARTKKYFFPALHLKIIGALAIGFIYQFYYGGGQPSGDTFHYFYHTGVIWDAFWDDSVITGLKLIFGANDGGLDVANYTYKMSWYNDPHSYFVVRVLGFFDLFTLHTYTASACLFAFTSFSGMWAMFLAFYRRYPILHKEIAIACFFIPSVFFWGSGILKDTLTIGALGWTTYGIFNIFIFRRRLVFSIFIVLISLWLSYSIKQYIALCFIPTLILAMSLERIKQIKTPILRYSIAPVIIAIAVGGIFFFFQKANEQQGRYSLDSISQTAEETAKWIHYVSETQGGAAYSLGDFDYSPTGMLKKMPLAIWVSLFRPYIWEVRNPVMLLSALESLWFLIFTFQTFRKNGIKRVFKEIRSSPILILCFSFSILFAFAVGVSTYNFGSLVRYKIPLMPFYICGLYIVGYNFKIQKLRKKQKSLQKNRSN
ncbi:MAG: hypothetical protein GY827_09220 [Cytophagales bacterium]|nr:hypothetical protein [Cytophagales bacterium]